MSHVDCSRKDSHFRGRYHNFPMTFHKTVPKERIQVQSHFVDVKHSGCEFISFDSTYIFTHVALLDCHNIVMHGRHCGPPRNCCLSLAVASSWPSTGL
jgi:hypothetical protein